MDKYVKDSDIYDIVILQFFASSDETEAALNAIIEGTRALPPADVRPVVRGKWERKRYGPWASRLKCSECGTLFDIATDSASWNFCPNCGADMREES